MRSDATAINEKWKEATPDAMKPAFNVDIPLIRGMAPMFGCWCNTVGCQRMVDIVIM